MNSEWGRSLATLVPAGTVSFSADGNEYRYILMQIEAVNCTFCKCYVYVKLLTSTRKTPLKCFPTKIWIQRWNKTKIIAQRQKYTPRKLISDWPQYISITQWIFLYQCSSLTQSTIVVTVVQSWCRKLSLHVSLKIYTSFGYRHHDADSIFRPLLQVTIFRIYGFVYFYFNAYRVIYSLCDTACGRQQISISVLQEFSFSSCRLASCRASVIHSQYNEVTRQKELHILYPIHYSPSTDHAKLHSLSSDTWNGTGKFLSAHAKMAERMYSSTLLYHGYFMPRPLYPGKQPRYPLNR